jgi:hypothetical protein
MTENPFPALYTGPRPPAGQCPECGGVHAPDSAHLAQSEQYRATIQARHGRRATWGDAIAHLTGERRREWEAFLAEMRIDPEADAWLGRESDEAG